MKKTILSLNTSRLRRMNLESREFYFLGEMNGIVLLESSLNKGVFYKIESDSFKKHFSALSPADDGEEQTDESRLKEILAQAIRL